MGLGILFSAFVVAEMLGVKAGFERPMQLTPSLGRRGQQRVWHVKLPRLLAGLDLPGAGLVVTGGRSVAGPYSSRMLMFQDPTLYPWRTAARMSGWGWRRTAS